MFDIKNAIDFYAKLLAEFDDFMADQASARHAMNCAITESRSRKFAQDDKWSFCLTAAKMAANQERR